MTRIKRYGYRRDRLDPRDRIFNLEESLRQPAKLPPACDLAGEMPDLYDQQQLGSCTANATAALLQHQQIKQGDPEGKQTPSRLFIYYEERRLGGYPLDQDTGAEVRDGIKVLVSEGAPPESDWPYDDTDPGPFQHKPSAQAFADALHYKATAYKRIVIGPGAPMRNAIAGGYPIAFGFPVPEQFEDAAWNPANTYLPLPGSSTRYVGGHAVVVVGYDWTLQRFPVPVFKIRNSWGPDWGEHGHFYADFRWFTPQLQLAADLWVVTHTT